MTRERPDENEEFADETVERREGQRRKRDEQKEGHQHGHRSREAAVLLDLVRVAAIVEHAGAEEERTGGYAVTQHLEDGALNRDGVERENSQHNKSKMTDGGVSDEALKIGLHHGDQRAVYDADDREHGDWLRHAVRRFGKKRQAESQNSVGTELQHDASQNHGAGRGSFGMRVRQPGVQREKRNFDGEGEEKCAEHQQFGVRREYELPGLHLRQDIRQIKRSRLGVEPQDGDQHEDRAEHGVQNEFDGRVNAPAVAPHADHEIHGDQRELPEHEKEEKVERKEDADHGRLDDQKRDEETLDVFVDGFPGAEDGDRREERSQQDQKQADAVHTQMVVNRVSD